MPVGVSAYVPLANITLSGSASSVTFSSISQSYRDLILVAQFVCATGSGYQRIEFNGIADNSSNTYSYNRISGDGSAVTADSYTQAYVTIGVLTSNSQQNFLTANIMDYSSTAAQKISLTRFGNTQYGTQMNTHRFMNTAAVNSIKIYGTAGNYNAGSTFTLYGVSA